MCNGAACLSTCSTTSKSGGCSGLLWVSCGCSGLFSCGVCSVSVRLTDICKGVKRHFFFPFHLTNPSHTMLHIHFASQSCPKPVSCSMSCASCPHFTGFLHQKERDELLEGLMGTSLTRNQKGIFQKYGLLERLINWDVLLQFIHSWEMAEMGRTEHEVVCTKKMHQPDQACKLGDGVAPGNFWRR